MLIKILAFLKTFNNKKELVGYLHSARLANLKIGLVPTMGALHDGHLSLVASSKKKCDITMATIFVNPTQFNNSTDLLKYPKPIESDTQMLISAGCDVLFNPEIDEMYEGGERWDYKVGKINTLLEGAFRPGHYEGVTQIVYKLFKLLKPDYAFFGQKDYQQFLVISQLVERFGLPIKLQACPIVREDDGLAMSSRNIRLSEKERISSRQLYNSLIFVKENYGKLSNAAVLEKAKDFYRDDLLKLEYLEIVNRGSLKTTDSQKEGIVLVACNVGDTRLIDNMMLP